MIIVRAAPDYAVIDVETTNLRHGEIPRTKFWGYADSKGYKRFETSRSFVRFLKTQSPKILLHHSNFDVIQLLVDGFTDIKILRSHNGRLIKSCFGEHILQNTLTAFPVSLREIFKAFGYEKSSLKNLDKRNYEDCVNGLECFLGLNDLFFNLVGVYPLSVGTVAGTTFRAAEMTAGKMPKDLRFFVAYRGGRVEVFSTNEFDASSYDINSSYPRSFLEADKREELLHVEVTTRDWHCPLFDSREHGMLLFPNGTFNSYVFRSNWEKYIEPYVEKTRLKILSKHPLDFSWICRLRDLVNTIYDKKSSTDSKGIKLCCKFLLNAFYGRIGLKPETERCEILDYKRLGDDVTSYRIGGKWVCFDKVEREVRSNYGFASFITDNARARLFQAFKRNTPYYGDTDSIFTSSKPRDFSESIGESCGLWSFKGTKKFKARNVKDYEWNGEQTVKGGVPGKEFLTWTLKQFAAGKTVIALKRERRTELRKRVVLPNGETIPLRVNN